MHCTRYGRLNPRFDGAFLNSVEDFLFQVVHCLNPRFDGAFLNSKKPATSAPLKCLNPRFDGAFLNYITAVNNYVIYSKS